MKKIKLDVPSDVIGLSNVDDNDENKVYAILIQNGMANVSVYYLCRRTKGYCFRDVHSNAGHSGFHPTIKEALAHAFTIPSTKEILQFNNMFGFSLWLVDVRFLS